MNDLENKSSRNNVIVFGAPEDERTTESLSDKINNESFSKKLVVAVNPIEWIPRLGQKNNNGHQPCIVNVYDHRQKQVLFEKARKRKEPNISVGDDFFRKLESIRKDSLMALWRTNGMVKKWFLCFTNSKLMTKFIQGTLKRTRGLGFIIAHQVNS